jgi:putative ABC transport system permease protein
MNLPGGVTDANTSALEQRLRLFPDAKVQTESQFKAFEKPIKGLLSLLYALLGLSVIVSVFGIINTLVLTVYERTRELGMLRAVGMTRRQVRTNDPAREHRHRADRGGTRDRDRLRPRRARHNRALEPGLRLRGAVRESCCVRARSGRRRILAAVLPARRASRLNGLEALQYE